MSSTKKRLHVCACDTTTVEPLPPSIPVDLLLEIFARADAKTVVRCAATSKPVCRAVLDPDFSRRLSRHARARATNGGFDPTTLVGISYVFDRSYYPIFSNYRVALVGHCFRFHAGLLSQHEPVAARGGLVVLRARRRADFYDERLELSVCNTLTGYKLRLPPADIDDKYPHALLDDGDAAGCSFQLLIADRGLRTQIFSLEHGTWSDLVQTDQTLLPKDFSQKFADHASHPVVLGRRHNVVHWLCSDHGIIALDVGTAWARLIELPPNCFYRVTTCQHGRDKGLCLIASADGRLSLLVPEHLTICLWTASAADEEAFSSSATTTHPRWTRQVVIQRNAIDRRNGPGWVVRFFGFGERSGTVILQMREVGLVEINLGSREARVLSREFKELDDYRLFQMCLHETYLSALIQTMRPF